MRRVSSWDQVGPGCGSWARAGDPERAMARRAAARRYVAGWDMGCVLRRRRYYWNDGRFHLRRSGMTITLQLELRAAGTLFVHDEDSGGCDDGACEERVG